MISDEKSTHSEFDGCLVLQLLWYVFNDFIYFTYLENLSKNMKMLILHWFFNDFGENPAAVNYQPGARQATSGPRERATKREEKHM